MSSHCLDCRRARSRPRLHLWRKWLARTPVALTVSRIQADVEQKHTKATKKKAAGTHAGRQVMGVPLRGPGRPLRRPKRSRGSSGGQGQVNLRRTQYRRVRCVLLRLFRFASVGGDLAAKLIEKRFFRECRPFCLPSKPCPAPLPARDRPLDSQVQVDPGLLILPPVRQSLQLRRKCTML